MIAAESQNQLSKSQHEAETSAHKLSALQVRLEQSSASQVALQQQLQAGEQKLQQRQTALEAQTAQYAQLEAKHGEQIATADAQLHRFDQAEQQLQTELETERRTVSGEILHAACCVNPVCVL